MSSSPKDLKDLGNRYFSQGNYAEAINTYTKAILKNPTNPILYTNRALANLKIDQWQQSIDDCSSALEHDHTLVKAHYFMGQALAEMSLYEDSITALNKAYTLSNEQKRFFGDDIASALRSVKKRKFQMMEQKRIQQEIELQKYLENLLDEDTRLRANESGDVKDVKEKNEMRKKELTNLFSAVDERRMKRDIPEFLCGKISFDLMTDPVITPSGITYDRKHIEAHLHRVGQFDPITRQPLSEDQLIPNLAMKEVIYNFIKENPWYDEY